MLECRRVLCTDPYIQDRSFAPLDEVLSACALLFIGCPHDVYRTVNLEGREVIDCWGLLRAQEASDRCRQPRKRPVDTVALPV